jgi:sugar transferase (PEP-CTERM system associated)
MERFMVSLFRHYVSVATIVQLAIEGCLFFLAVLFAVGLQRNGMTASAESFAVPAIVFAVVMVCVNTAFGLYRRDHPLEFTALVARATAAFGVGFGVAYVLFVFFPQGVILQDALWITVVYAFAGVLLARQALSLRLMSGLFPYRVLVVGVGPEAAAIDRSIGALNQPNVKLVGFYPVKVPGQAPAVSGKRVLPAQWSIGEAVRRLDADEVVVAVRDQRGGAVPLTELLDCRVAGVRVTDVARFFERARGEVPVEALKASWFIYGEGFTQSAARNAVKRAFDVAAAAVLLLVAAPVMLLAAAAIRLESAGPVIYRQERVGRGGRPFMLFKFRSMVQNAESDGRARWAAVNDARVTRTGRILRRSRIDELPQLWNVLRGEMSFVGPRPERPAFVAQLAAEIPFYNVRHCVKPGVTGWAQVRFTYGASIEDTVRKLQFDLYYVKNHSLFLDIVILLETVRVVLFGEGAR